MTEIERQDEASNANQHRLAVLAEDTRTRMKRSALDIYHIGANLLEAQSLLPHGEFLHWIKAEFGMSKSSAYRFMDVGRAFQDKLPKMGNLEIAASALYRLATPSTPEAARDEAIELAAAGENLTDEKALQIVRKHKSPKTDETPTPQKSNSLFQWIEQIRNEYAQRKHCDPECIQVLPIAFEPDNLAEWEGWDEQVVCPVDGQAYSIWIKALAIDVEAHEVGQAEVSDEYTPDYEKSAPADLTSVGSAADMDALIDSNSVRAVAQEFADADPATRAQIRNYYPGIDSIVKDELGEEALTRIQLVDAAANQPTSDQPEPPTIQSQWSHNRPLAFPSVNATPTRVKQKLEQKAEELGLPTSSNQVLPDVERNHLSPLDVDDRPFANPLPIDAAVNQQPELKLVLSEAVEACLGNFTMPENLDEPLQGNVYISPNTAIEQWVSKLLRSYFDGEVKEAIALLSLDHQVFAKFADHALCPLPESMVAVYLGRRVDNFVLCFEDLGTVWHRFGWCP